MFGQTPFLFDGFQTIVLNANLLLYSKKINIRPADSFFFLHTPHARLKINIFLMGIAFAITTSGVFIMKINLFYSKKLYHIAYLSIPLCTNIGPLRRYFWEKRDVLYITQFFCISFVMLPDCKPTYDDHTQYEFEIDWIIPRIKIRDEGFLFVCSRGAYCIFFSCVIQKLFKRTLVIWTRKTLSWKRITLKRDWYMKGVFLLWMKCGSKLLQFRTLSGMYHFFIKKKICTHCTLSREIIIQSQFWSSYTI